MAKKRAVPQDKLWNFLLTSTPEAIREKYGIMESLSHGLRGAITATAGKMLYVADYAAIEARVVLWLARDDDALAVFERAKTCPCRKDGREACNLCDTYCDMASDVYRYPTNKRDNPKERGIGKIAVLGLGYQMGASKFVDTCAAGGVTIVEDSVCVQCDRPSRDHRDIRSHTFRAADPDEITAVKIVDAYRAKYWRVKEMWADQEETAILAVENEGETFTAGRVTWHVEDGFLYCTLPSGRRLAYPDPVVGQQRTSWGAIRPQLKFMGVNPYNHQWQSQTTYGGMLVENITQAVARDIMAAAFMRCEASGIWVPILTVHDELIAEGEPGLDVKAFERLVAAPLDWAPGCPIEAEGWSGFRYRK